MTWLKICVWSAKEIVFLILSEPLLTFFHIKRNCIHWHNFPSWLRTGLALGRLNNRFEWQGHTARAVSVLSAGCGSCAPWHKHTGSKHCVHMSCSLSLSPSLTSGTGSAAPAGSLLPFAWWSCLNNSEGSNFLYSLRMKWYFTAAKLHKDLRLTKQVTGSKPNF